MLPPPRECEKIVKTPSTAMIGIIMMGNLAIKNSVESRGMTAQGEMFAQAAGFVFDGRAIQKTESKIPTRMRVPRSTDHSGL